ncbi:MAG: hypothetical protein WAL59_13835, partial [Roseiarcus sp.]
REGRLPSAGRQALARTPAPRKVGQPILRGQSPSGAAVMSGTIEIEVAPGELVDKLAILEINHD